MKWKGKGCLNLHIFLMEQLIVATHGLNALKMTRKPMFMHKICLLNCKIMKGLLD